jgi:two-component system CheB/CheR fusion protein
MDRKRLEDALRVAELKCERCEIRAELDAVLNATHAQLAVFDTHLRFVMVNAAYARACGHRREELIGRRHFDFFPNAENEEIFRRVAATATPFYVEEKPFVFADQPGRGVTYWNWSLVPMIDAAGQVRRLLLSLTDVTGQVNARIALEALAAEQRRTEEALRDADRRKTEFIGVLSHELRNPLAPVRTALSLLDSVPPGCAQARRAKQIIDRQVVHLCRIVDDLLDITRITHGKYELRKTRVEAVALVTRTVEDYRGLFAAHGIHLARRPGVDSVWLDADATRISQAVGNLLQNAAKFTRRGGRVDVTVTRESGTALISVRDDGAGIDPAILARIFEPFTQADDGLHRSRGGLGLGLSLVKSVVELHGGSVEARSEGLGRGAELVLRLPVAPEPVAPEPVAPEGGESRAPAGPTPAPCGRGRRVLVVEDNLDAAETLRELLVAWGHEAEVAHDGPEGVDKARAFLPDVVLCDVGLPGMNGYEVGRAIRADPALASTFLVALTGYASADDQRRAAEAGFDRHLAKPPSIEQLQGVLSGSVPIPAS